MIQIFFHDQTDTQLMTIQPPTHLQMARDDLTRLQAQISKLQREKAQLLEIAFHLSQAVTRLGNSAIGIDSCYEHNDVVGAAQKSQEDLQEWIARNVGVASNVVVVEDMEG